MSGPDFGWYEEQPDPEEHTDRVERLDDEAEAANR